MNIGKQPAGSISVKHLLYVGLVLKKVYFVDYCCDCHNFSLLFVIFCILLSYFYFLRTWGCCCATHFRPVPYMAVCLSRAAYSTQSSCLPCERRQLFVSSVVQLTKVPLFALNANIWMVSKLIFKVFCLFVYEFNWWIVLFCFSLFAIVWMLGLHSFHLFSSAAREMI